MNVGNGSRGGVGKTTSKTVETLWVEVGQRGADSANIVGWQGNSYGCGEYGSCYAVCIVDIVCVVIGGIGFRSGFPEVSAHPAKSV